MSHKQIYFICFIIWMNAIGVIQAQQVTVSFYHYYKFEGDADPAFDLYVTSAGALASGDEIEQERIKRGETPGTYPLNANIMRGNTNVTSSYSHAFNEGSLTILGLEIATLGVNGGVTIGSSSEPAGGALLQLKENNNDGINSTKGLLLGRVKLTSLNNLNDIEPGLNKEVHIGLIIYNETENASLSLHKGFYVWDGSKWRSIQAF